MCIKGNFNYSIELKHLFFANSHKLWIHKEKKFNTPIFFVISCSLDIRENSKAGLITLQCRWYLNLSTGVLLENWVQINYVYLKIKFSENIKSI